MKKLIQKQSHTGTKSAAQQSQSNKSVYIKDNRPVQKKPNNTGLPDNLKSGIENISGYAMDDVKVHYNSSQPRQLQAHAFAQGTNIHIAPGQEKHLPHEAWHVVQQKQGRVKPTLQMKGKYNINDDKGLEHEADVMGSKALQLASQSAPSAKINSLSAKNGTAQLSANVIQREEFIGSPASYHMHIDIHQPHYKYGNDRSSRIDIGPDGSYRIHDLQEVINLLRGNTDTYAKKCYDWCLREASAIHRGGNAKAERRAVKRGW